jgi:hypothetical protein
MKQTYSKHPLEFQPAMANLKTYFKLQVNWLPEIGGRVVYR